MWWEGIIDLDDCGSSHRHLPRLGLLLRQLSLQPHTLTSTDALATVLPRSYPTNFGSAAVAVVGRGGMIWHADVEVDVQRDLADLGNC
jgi:hypothetical protein